VDRDASFREFVLRRGPALSRVAYLLTGDHQLAEDLLQTALARSVPRWSRLVAAGDPEAYVRRIMVNERTTWWRRGRYERVGHVDLGPEPATGADEADRVVLRASLLAALSRLTPRQRTVLVLRFYADLSVEDTAHALGCSIGTVKSTTSDALSRLRTATTDLRTVM
jgi:RNA polymerase sigma-70 factor (sigma-E family)